MNTLFIISLITFAIGVALAILARIEVRNRRRVFADNLAAACAIAHRKGYEKGVRDSTASMVLLREARAMAQHGGREDGHD